MNEQDGTTITFTTRMASRRTRVYNSRFRKAELLSEIIVALVSIVSTVFIGLIILNVIAREKGVQYLIPAHYKIGDAQFLRSMGVLLGPPLVDGNVVVGLLNGDQIFPAMLTAIRNAEKTICMEMYIYWSGNVGRDFANALAERSRSGVKVHLLIDWVGSAKLDGAALQEMKDAGVQVERYRPPRWYNLTRLNNRTHRKLLVLDGKIGFTGGVGIADHWLGNADSPDHWRDSHYRLEGPAAAYMQSAFMDNWLKTRAEVLDGEEYFPALEPVGPSTAQVFKSSAREGSESVRLMYLLSIVSARQSIRLASAYFVPDKLSVMSLVEARKRGVRIEIIVPGPHIDVSVVRRASRSLWGPLLEANVEIYEYQPTMYHCKVLIVDDLWVSVGSTNFDDRSFRHNDEVNMNVLDRDFATQQAKEFEQDQQRSQRITLQDWKNRPRTEKFVEFLAGLLRPQL